MYYEEVRPDPALTRCVHCYWFLSGSGPATLQPIVPDGRMELILNLADRFLRHRADGSVERQPAALLAGQMTTCVLVEPSGSVDLVGVRFQPAGAALLLPLPPRELRDCIIDPALVAGGLARDLADRLHTTHDVPGRVRILNAHFALLQATATDPDRAVVAAVALIHGSHGRVRIADAAAQLGMTRRTLERRVDATVGIGPKLLARITRFQHTFAQMQTSGPRAWTRIAHRSGYYDQAHLNRDFRAFAGASPTRFFAGHTTLADFFATGGNADDLPRGTA